MKEVVCHLHAHSAYSDGALYHAEIAEQAAQTDVDVVWITDHNVRVRGVDGWRAANGRRILVLAGEEIHQQDRIPQKNHLLVYGPAAELAGLADRPQALLDAVNAAGGAAFLAHPNDPASALVGEPDLGWVDWSVRGFTGIEIWNTMSEFKSRIQNPGALLWNVFFPSTGICGPFPQTLALWDSLLARGIRTTAIGSSDAHGARYSAGPIRRTVFPYTFLLRTVNMHLLLPRPLAFEAKEDARALVEGLRAGCGWVGYDLPHSTRGFSFFAKGARGRVEMGGATPMVDRPVLQAVLPATACLCLIRAGYGVVWKGMGSQMKYPVTEPGAYRLEARRFFRGRMRGWIFSNPITIVE